MIKFCKNDVVPHSSHAMGEWHSAIRAPSGTERFYSVRVCTCCGAEEGMHAAGHYMEDDLRRHCSAEPEDAS